MKTLEFDARVGSDSTLRVPEAEAAQVRAGEPVHVVLMLAERGEASDWQRLTGEQFLSGYDAGDSIYDDLPTG